jgi:hypothetical protein
MAIAIKLTVDQPTRLISHSPNRLSQVDSKTSGSESVMNADDPDAAQRLAGELEYVAHFAPTIGSLAGLNTLRFGLLEDRDGQTVFAQNGSTWTGRISSTRRTIKQARTALSRP